MVYDNHKKVVNILPRPEEPGQVGDVLCLFAYLRVLVVFGWLFLH